MTQSIENQACIETCKPNNKQSGCTKTMESEPVVGRMWATERKIEIEKKLS